MSCYLIFYGTFRFLNELLRGDNPRVFELFTPAQLIGLAIIPAGVLLLVKSDRYTETSAKMLSYGVMTLPKPTSSQMLTQTLGVLCATRERLRQMEEKQLSVEQKMEEIRLVNRAKWLLIETLGMSEAESHRYIEKQAMDLRISKAQVARNIIHTYQG